MWIQIVASIFVAFVLLRVVDNYRKRRISAAASAGWFVVWVMVIIVFWSPDVASRLAFFLGVGRGADLIVYSAIVIIVYLLYRIFVRIEKLNRDVTILTRELALRNGAQKENRSSTDR